MPHPTDRGIRISSLHCINLSPDEQLDIRRHMEKLNDGSASFVEHDVNDVGILYLRKRTWSDWWRESVAEFKAGFDLVEELKHLKNAKVAAMRTLACALGVLLDNGLDQQLREAARETNFRLADVSRVIAPETLDLSNKSFLISGFEKFDDRRRLRRAHELNRLVKEGKGPLRVDQVKDAENKVQTYVRTRSTREAFAEFWMSAKERRSIEDAARNAIAEAFEPYLTKHRETERDVIEGPRHAPAGISTDDVRELLSHLHTRVWSGKTVQGALSVAADAREESRLPSSRMLKAPVSNGVKHAPLIGCSVVQAHPLGFAANNIIVPLAGIRNMRCEGNRVLEQSQAVALEAEQKFRKQMKWLKQEADRRRKKWGQACTDQPVASPDRLDSEKPRFAMERFPQKMQSGRDTFNLLLVDFPDAVGAEDDDRDEKYWYDFYSSLLSSLKGTVVLGPMPDQKGQGFSEENLHGLVRACLDRSSISFSRSTGQDLLAITIAHEDKRVSEFISKTLAGMDTLEAKAKAYAKRAASQAASTQSDRPSTDERMASLGDEVNEDMDCPNDYDGDTDLEYDGDDTFISSDIEDDVSTVKPTDGEADTKPTIPPHELAPHIFAAPVPGDEESDDGEEGVAKLDMNSKLEMHPDEFEGGNQLPLNKLRFNPFRRFKEV